MSSAIRGPFMMVSIVYSNPARPFRCAMFSIDPVDRLSMTMTRSPRSSRASARCDPTKPAPPVSSAFIVRPSYPPLGDCRRHKRKRGVVEPGVERQRADLRAHAIGDRTGGGRTRERALSRHRNGVVDEGPDAASGEVLEKAIARARERDEQVIHVAGIALGRQRDGRASE